MLNENLDETAQAILQSASRRFLHYGFKKTTMSEIAGDCKMSTGNLYRYFQSKLDIVETFVRELRAEQIERLKNIADEPEMCAREKIRAFFEFKLKTAYERFHDNPKAYELSTELIQERPSFATEWEAAERDILGAIIQDGAVRGNFAIEDAYQSARILQDAAYRFTTAAVYHEGEYEEISVELHLVLNVMLDGFAYRASQAKAN